MTYRECLTCLEKIDSKLFRVFKSGNLSSECNKCRYKREKSKLKKIEKLGPFIPSDMKMCKTCKKIKLKVDFSKYLHKRDNKERLKISCKDCRRKESRLLYSKNVEKYKRNTKEYSSRNKEELKRKRTIREAEKRKDRGYRLRLAMYSSIRRALVGNRSKTKILSNIGYSEKELSDHLERQFDKKMSWDNYGTYWNIDHIIPASQFSYESERDDDFLRCWSLTNLRPLSIKENIKKSNKLTHLI